jgi:hypothetical protein
VKAEDIPIHRHPKWTGKVEDLASLVSEALCNPVPYNSRDGTWMQAYFKTDEEVVDDLYVNVKHKCSGAVQTVVTLHLKEYRMPRELHAKDDVGVHDWAEEACERRDAMIKQLKFDCDLAREQKDATMEELCIALEEKEKALKERDQGLVCALLPR